MVETENEPDFDLNDGFDESGDESESKEDPKDEGADESISEEVDIEKQEIISRIELNKAKTTFYQKAGSACATITGVGQLIPLLEGIMKANMSETVTNMTEVIGQKIESRVTAGLRQTIWKLLVDVELIEPQALDQIRQYEERNQRQSNPNNYVPPAPVNPTGAEEAIDLPGDVQL